ncbi:hypothetical protein ALC56_03163, partial [Trachymyrmex septentrionalis]
GAHNPYPGGSHATASQSAGCAAVRKEFARAGLIREPGSPGTSTLPYTARTLTANYDVPREYNNSRGRPYLFPRNTTPRKSGRVAP